MSCEEQIEHAQFWFDMDLTDLENGQWSQVYSRSINNNLRVQVWYFILADCNESGDKYKIKLEIDAFNDGSHVT